MKLSEKGFTLVEVMIAISITALMVGAGSMTTLQIIKGAELSNDHMTALSQVQNAGYWVSRDAQMSKIITIDGLTPPTFLVLGWTEDELIQHEVTYALEPTDGSDLKRLLRSHSVDGVVADTAFIARYIDPAPQLTKRQIIDGVFILTVTATVDFHSQTKTETRVYEVVPRPN